MKSMDKKLSLVVLQVQNNTMMVKAPPPSKKSVFVRKIEIEINAWEDSPSSPLSETL
jgi:hypothetical protein